MNLSREFISEHLKQDGIAIVATHQDLSVAAPRFQRLQLFLVANSSIQSTVRLDGPGAI